MNGAGGRPGKGTAGVDRSPFPEGGLRHDALFYADDRDYRAAVEEFVEAGRAAGEPVLVAVPTDRLHLVQPLLAPLDGVELADMAVIGRNPAAIIATTLRGFVHRFPGRRVRVVGESLWPGRRPAAYRHCVEHEAIINLGLADQPLTMRCLFDRSRLPAGTLADVAGTHPWLVSGGVARPSAGYRSPRSVLRRLARPLPPPPGDALTEPVRPERLGSLRAAVAAVAEAAGLAAERVDDLRIAVTELASNALTHGTGPAIARCWAAAGDLVCEVSGPGELTDSLAGRIPPPATAVRGRGLLLVHRLCDLVDVHVADGVTTVPAAPGAAGRPGAGAAVSPGRRPGRVRPPGPALRRPGSARPPGRAAA
ncbi:anti-sigma factor RsbA family regulatory protein [Micromonospora terminaliae]|uniref:Sensor histidine kinase n=1 Tax=Micromonospora terminaliae TaxID=1914461 RepID=A0AAJ2ZIZ4_9ACTN|nr:anti-sigma factor RsbA family regulatory protein [Micromonospora terminaliae]NES30940.1 sensor histidine kinase [Micromonospora terminaliae]